MTNGVRAGLIFTALLLLGSLAGAQVQEKKLSDRIMRPDMTLAYPVQGKAFYDGKTFQSSGSPDTRAFAFSRAFVSKDFSTKTFYGAGSWGGNFKFSTTQANTKGNYEVPNAGTKVDTKTQDVHNASETRRESPTRTYATREYRGPEAKKLKTELKSEPEVGNMKQMTIDDVRDLLNKNK